MRLHFSGPLFKFLYLLLIFIHFDKERNLPNISPHDLRHSCASLLLMSGASVKDAQDFMGHADAGTTLKYYVATTDERLAKAANALADALNF